MKKIVKVEQRFPIYSTPMLLVLTCYISLIHLLQWMNHYWKSLNKVHTVLRSLNFYLTSFFCSMDHFQNTILHLVIMSPLAPLGFDHFLDFPCFWWLWQFWGVLVRYFVQCLSIEICLVFFSWLNWGKRWQRLTTSYQEHRI